MGAGLWWTRADGAGQPRGLLSWHIFQYPISSSPDGTRLAFGADRRLVTSLVGRRGRGPGSAECGDTLAVPHDSPPRRRRGLFGRWPMDSPMTRTSQADLRSMCARFAVRAGQRKQDRDFQQRRIRARLVAEWTGALSIITVSRIMVVGYRTTDGSFLAEKPRVWADNVGGVLGLSTSPRTLGGSPSCCRPRPVTRRDRIAHRGLR